MTTLPEGSKLELTTLCELGYNLPIGRRTGSSGALAKSFKLKPYRMKEERQLAEFKNKNKGAVTLGTYVTQILALMVESYGDQDITAMGDAEKRLLFNNAYMADVMYMYCMLRREAMGENIHLRVPCGLCHNRFDFMADINTLDVLVAKKHEDIYWTHKLKTALLFNGAPRGILKLRPVLWSTLTDKHASDSAGQQGAAIAGTIVGMDGIPDNEMAPVVESSLSEMTKFDIEMVSKSIGEHSPGPQMGVEEPCSFCHNTLFWPIDWGYDSFFSSSSL